MVEVAHLPTTCARCDKHFLAKRPTRKFCSGYCRHTFYVPLHPQTEKSKCEGCGKAIVKKRPNHKFCSERCNNRAYIEQHRPAYNARMRRFHHHTRQTTPWKLLVAGAKIRAKNEDVPFDLDEAWGRERWTGRCELSDIPFVTNTGKRNIFSATVDRIRAGKGYTKENCRIILWAINAFKHDGSDADMYDIAKALIANKPI